MKDFAKSIVCNVKAEVAKVGNFDDPKDAKRYIQMWERRKNDAKSWIDDAHRKLKELHKDHGGAFGPLSDYEKRRHKEEAQKHEETIRKYQAEFEKYDNLIKQAQKATWGNAKCGNAEVFKDGDVWVVLYAEGTKSKEFNTEAEAKKFAAQVGNSVPDDMINGPAAAEIREAAGRVYKKEMREYDLARATAFELAKKYKNFQKSSTFMETIKDVLKKFKTGNSKVGNVDKYSGNYIIMSDDGNVWFRDEHEDVSIRNIDSWAQKRISEYQRSIDEIKKGVQEAKQAAKKYGLI